MKFIFSNIILLYTTYTFAQVGINIDTPNASFDVERDKNKPVNEDVVGIKIPIISKQQLGNKNIYTDDQKGTIIFINGLDYTGDNPSVENVEDNKYFYIFNGETWKSSVYTLSGSSFIIESTSNQGFSNTEAEQPIKIYQTGDKVTPENSSLFNYQNNGDYLTVNEKGMYAISGFFFFRPRPISGENTQSQSLVKISVQKRKSNTNNWETISSVSKYFYGTAGFFGTTIPIPENILNLDKDDNIRFTIKIPSSVGSVTMDGFYSSGDNMGTFSLSGSSGSNHVVQNISRILSIQKL